MLKTAKRWNVAAVADSSHIYSGGRARTRKKWNHRILNLGKSKMNHRSCVYVLRRHRVPQSLCGRLNECKTHYTKWKMYKVEKWQERTNNNGTESGGWGEKNKKQAQQKPNAAFAKPRNVTQRAALIFIYIQICSFLFVKYVSRCFSFYLFLAIDFVFLHHFGFLSLRLCTFWLIIYIGIYV